MSSYLLYLCCSFYILYSISHSKFILGPEPPARPCSANGYHNVTSLNLKGSKEFCEKGSLRFDEVTLRCHSSETLQFIQHCDKEGKSGIKI